MNSVKSVLIDAVKRIATEHPRLDAEVLLAHALNVPRSWLGAHPEAIISTDEHTRYNLSVHQVSQGTPLPYVLGHWEFYGLDFKLDSRSLIPRPETEMLVEEAVNIGFSFLGEISIADIGTGNGIIAITLALKLPQANIIATDVSCEALELARENAFEHGVSDRVSFAHGDLLEGLGMFDLICTNPPYIASEELDTLPVARHEPRLALDGGEDGLHIIGQLLSNSGDHLNPSGALLMEIGADQADASCAIARAAFPTGNVQVAKDMAGRDRLLSVRTNGPVN